MRSLSRGPRVVQIAVTLVINIGMVQFGGYDFYMWAFTAGYWTKSVSFLLTFAILLSMMCYKNKFPLNLILLFAFTACMSYTLGMTTLAYAANGMQVIVVEAFAITALIFVALTAFVMLSKVR